MIKIPKRVVDRMKEGLKRYKKITSTLREQDVSEADTVTVVKDILSDIYGYDKYLEITGEQQIKGSFCDLAVKLDGKIKYLIEVKSVGSDLTDSHTKQAVNYGAHHGIEWIVLTNGIEWHLYKLKFSQPIEHEEFANFDLQDIDVKNDDDLRKLFLLSREAAGDGAMAEYHKHTQLMNKYTIAQVVQMDPVVKSIRREFRKLFPDIKIDEDDVSEMLEDEILKRDVVESEKAEDAAKLVRKGVRKVARKKQKKQEKESREKAEQRTDLVHQAGGDGSDDELLDSTATPESADQTEASS